MAKENWEVDFVHSSLGFTVRHMVISKVHGVFGKWAASFSLDTEDFPASSVSVEVDIASIDTKEEKRDGHLKSADFFDAEKFPKMTFKSTKVEKTGGDRLAITGDLTIRGTTKSVVLDAEYAGRAKDPWGGERAGFAASTKINRKDFGLHWNQALETGGVLVGEQVEIKVDLELTRAK
ncbi:MAG TPA: YceI family protein [Polyangiaceae bacterium]|jgi:polyisoprenoid-binding protein YceI|nr:YceI family protein [Polyangiaceae bacterium]